MTGPKVDRRGSHFWHHLTPGSEDHLRAKLKRPGRVLSAGHLAEVGIERVAVGGSHDHSVGEIEGLGAELKRPLFHYAEGAEYGDVHVPEGRIAKRVSAQVAECIHRRRGESRCIEPGRRSGIGDTRVSHQVGSKVTGVAGVGEVARYGDVVGNAGAGRGNSVELPS